MQQVVGGWSSGTGMSGVSGAALYFAMSLAGLSDSTIFFIQVTRPPPPNRTRVINTTPDLPLLPLTPCALPPISARHRPPVHARVLVGQAQPAARCCPRRHVVHAVRNIISLL